MPFQWSSIIESSQASSKKKHVDLATAVYSTKFGWQFLIKSLQFELDLQIGHIVSFVYKIYISVILLKEILHHRLDV